MLCSRTRLSLSPSTTCLRLLFDQTVLWIAQAIEAAGIGIIVLGGVVATALFVRRLSRTEGFAGSYHRYRENLGEPFCLAWSSWSPPTSSVRSRWPRPSG